MLTRELPDGTDLRTGFAKWSRPLWMRLGALGAVCAALILLCAPVGAAQLRQAAQIQFMHAMSTFACATFMNVGGGSAKHAPACFVAGSLLYSLPIYVAYARGPAPSSICTLAGEVLLIGGWVVLIWSASSIDRISAPK
jgi:uncharacterized membrane protein YgdD (TMEM256/DUF423 family)